MREFILTLAAVCSVSGVLLSFIGLFDRSSDDWTHGFTTGCAAMALTVFLAAILVAAWTR